MDKLKADYLKSELYKCKDYLKGKGYNVVYLCIFGSQNYDLDIYTDDYKSDIDFKAVIIPTLDDLVYNCKPISTTIEYNGGQIDLKDIRSWVDTLVKANPAYIETLYTSLGIIDEDYREYIIPILRLRFALLYSLRAQFARAVYGMARAREAAFEHPCPSCISDIEKYKYSRKQLHHIVRFFYLLYGYVYDGYLSLEPTEEQKTFLLDIKIGKYKYEDACKIRDEYMQKLKILKDTYLDSIDEKTINYKVKEYVLDNARMVIKKSIIKEAKGIDLDKA